MVIYKIRDKYLDGSLIRLLSLFKYILDESGTAENKVEVLFSHDKLLLTSILRPLHQVTEEMLTNISSVTPQPFRFDHLGDSPQKDTPGDCQFRTTS